ncbi:MAG: helix-turn-helix domain-containing protein [Nitrospinota bacterium]
MKYNKLEVGERLAEIRKKRQITQVQAAKLFGTRQQHISAYESGKSQAPSEYLFWVAGEFGVTVDYILTGQTPAEYSARTAEAETKYGVGSLSTDEVELIRLYRDAPVDGRAAAKAVLEIYQHKKEVGI